MSAIDYASIAQDAAQAITDAGQSILIRRPDPARVFNKAEGEYEGGGAPADTAVLGVVLPSLPGWVSLRSRSLIEPGDEFVLIEAGKIEPLRTDRVVAEGREYQIIDLERLAPAGIPVLYTLHVRP